MWKSVISGGSKGGAREACPPGVEILSISCSFGKIWQNHMLAPPGESAPPPRGNPGSATGNAFVQKTNDYPKVTISF